MDRAELIEEALTEWYGPRCPDFADGCPCCLAWAEYDWLLSEKTGLMPQWLVEDILDAP